MHFEKEKVCDFSFNSGVYLMCELDASNNMERSNKIETLLSTVLGTFWVVFITFSNFWCEIAIVAVQAKSS